MVKKYTISDNFYLPDSQSRKLKLTKKPSQKALSFVLNYAKYSSFIKVKSISPFVIIEN